MAGTDGWGSLKGLRADLTTEHVDLRIEPDLATEHIDLRIESNLAARQVVEALAAAVEAKDQATGSHLYRSAFLANACLEFLDPGLAACDEVVFGFVLHDVGKIGIPDRVLNKVGGLDDEEWKIMRTHPEVGMAIVRPLGFGKLTTDVILTHHERFDGLGYPNGLVGSEIPLTARVFAVADTYDAMTVERSYRSAMTKDEARAEISAGAGTHFDPQAVEAFLTLVR